MSYNRSDAVAYARKWALSRNPKYYNFDAVGGDCTSFVSQCLFAGFKVMNYNYLKGWYYKNGNDKSPSWSGVEFLYEFLINNKLAGPKGVLVSRNDIEIGDIAQLSFDGSVFGHSLLITKIENKQDLSGIFVSAHTFDALDKRISEYNFSKIRFIHIKD